MPHLQVSFYQQHDAHLLIVGHKREGQSSADLNDRKCDFQKPNARTAFSRDRRSLPVGVTASSTVTLASQVGYSLTGGHEHMRLRSPCTLSTRPTGGQYLSGPVPPSGKQPVARL